jgi:polyketide synthase PksJ
VSVGWNKWLEVGMAARFARRPQLKSVGQIQVRRHVQDGTKPMHPIFDLRVNTEPNQHAYLTRFSVNRHWVLNEHRIRGHAVIPGTAYLEMARAAFEEIAGIREIEISDAVFVAPLLVNDDKDAEVRTSIHKNGVGYRFLIESKREAEEGVEPQWTAHAVGDINYLTKQSDGNSNLKELIKTCEREGILIEGEEHYRELGPRWHNLKKIYFGEDEGIAALELSSEYLADLDAFKLHPSILDMSTGFLAARFLGEGDYLPFLYRSIRIKAPLPRRVYSYVKFKKSRDSSKETVSFDVVIADEDGAELVRIKDFRMKRVGSVTNTLRSVSGANGARANTGRPILPGVAAFPPVVAQKPASEVLEGILPKEGADAFSRILLHSAMPQVFVVPQDLPTLIQHFSSLKVGSTRREVEQLSETKQAHPRPELEQEYIAPRSEVEETIASIWRAILGIDQIGVDDNFFDLGGDSLIALQLSSRLRDSFRVEPSVSGVFDSPTVAGLAVLVAQSAAESVDNELLTQLLNELEG